MFGTCIVAWQMPSTSSTVFVEQVKEKILDEKQTRETCVMVCIYMSNSKVSWGKEGRGVQPSQLLSGVASCLK